MSRVRFNAGLVNGFAFKSSDFMNEATASSLPVVRVRDVMATEFTTFIDKSKVPPEAIVQNGDIVIGMDGDFNSAYWDRGPAALNQRVCLIRTDDEARARFISYVIPTELQSINDMTFFTTVKHLSSGQVLNLRLPELGDAEVRVLVNYLDRETAEIDAMSVDLDEMEAYLDERRAKIIKERLLPPDGTYSRMKFVAQVSLGKTVQGSQKVDGEVERNYIRAAHIQPRGQLVLDDKTMWFSQRELAQLNLLAGDVLIVEGGAGYGRSVYLPEDMPDWGFQNHVIRVRPRGVWLGEFLHMTVMAHYGAGLIDVMADGATIPGLSSDKAREIPVLDVDEHRQREIVNDVNEGLSEIDSMLADIQELRALLAERRSALITAAVTGQIDIPGLTEAHDGEDH